jgi:mono/diheme cytochrome c family protein
LFQGRSDGAFLAYDARSGEPLWETHVGVGIMAPPMSYAIDGQQYVAVVAGVGGSSALDTVRRSVVNQGRIFAWKLGGTAQLPPATPLPPGRVDAPPFDTSPETVALGRARYAEHCLRCHGLSAQSSGMIPDLRYASREVHQSWGDIVLGGTRAAKGMASFADVLSQKESDAIHAYVIERALHEPTALESLVKWFGAYACMPVSWLVD